MNKKISISCIIPAFNEQQSIAQVLQAASMVQEIKEVIVVDDGSIDSTAELVGDFPKIKLIRHLKNQGKTAAVFSGLEQAKGNIILLLDADLVNLKSENIRALVAPQYKKECITISRRKNAYPILSRKVAIFSGERSFPREILEEIKKKYSKKAGYALEALINRQALRLGLEFVSVPWDDVTYIRKAKKKHGVFLWSEIKMLFSIYSHFSLFSGLYQQIVIPNVTKTSVGSLQSLE